MASLISSVGHYCCITKALLAHHQLTNGIIVSSCHVRRHSNDSNNSQEGKKKDMDGGRLKNNSLVKLRLLSLLNGFERFGRRTKQNLSPEQKGGDWKDLFLMSLSFAVYVCISQKLVCAYFVWTTMPKQLW